jgi:NADPH:quinone reductase-like Zn-dependent oxidoreductase
MVPAGGFGMFLLQLLKSTGANTTVVVCTNAIAVAMEWGTASVIDYKKEDGFSKKKVFYDAMIDLSGRIRYTKTRQIMKPKSVFINPTPTPVDILTSPLKNFFRGKKAWIEN